MNPKIRPALIAITFNLLLSAVKVVIGLMINSSAILSAGVNSTADVFSSIIALVSVIKAGKAPDSTHPYGHGKFETVGTFLEALLILGSGVFVVIEAVNKLMYGVTIQDFDIGLLVMSITVVGYHFMSTYLIRRGQELDSTVIAAIGWDYRTDLYSSIGVLASIVMIRFTGWKIIDPMVALVISVLVFRVGIRIGREAFNVLVERRLPREKETLIRETIEKYRGSFLDYHDLRSRSIGSRLEIDFHLTFPPDTTVREANDVSRTVCSDIKNILPAAEVLVHIDSEDKPV